MGHLRTITWKSALNDEEGKLTRLKFTWLRNNFEHLLSRPMQIDIIYDARSYILQLISGVLMSDVNQNKVHITYLLLLENLDQAKNYS